MKFPILCCTLLCVSCSSGLGPVVPKTKVERQMIGLLEKFDRWDYDGDGFLDRKELSEGIAGLRGKPQEVSYTAEEVIDFYDTNHDRKISIMEAQAGYKRSTEAETRLQGAPQP
jgi:Ca2+-binding EF-hand superfamily protein